MPSRGIHGGNRLRDPGNERVLIAEVLTAPTAVDGDGDAQSAAVRREADPDQRTGIHERRDPVADLGVHQLDDVETLAGTCSVEPVAGHQRVAA